jgi:hypothetical protein
MSMTRNCAGSIGELTVPLTGPAVWAAHLFTLYGAEALLCSMPTPSVAMLWFAAMAATAIAAILLLGFMLWQARRKNRHAATRFFLRELSLVLAGLALLGVLWTSLPAASVPACTPGPG